MIAQMGAGYNYKGTAMTDTLFGTDRTVTLAQAIAYTAKLHSFITGDKYEFKEGRPWYKVYADYAVSCGILQSEITSYDSNLTREEFADILTHTVAASALPGINTVEDNAIPDVSIDDEYGASIYLLYRAGIFTGETEDGAFRPKDNVTRGEVAQALARMAASSMRLFKAQTGSTVHGYIRQKRLLKAAQLIREGAPVTKAAAECGFNDYSAFHRAFRDTFNISPSELKR